MKHFYDEASVSSNSGEDDNTDDLNPRKKPRFEDNVPYDVVPNIQHKTGWWFGFAGGYQDGKVGREGRARHALTEVEYSDNSHLSIANYQSKHSHIWGPPESVHNWTKLFLAHSGVARLPESIKYLWRVTLLDVSSNQLKSLPKSIVLLHQLKTLNLKNNLLRLLPDMTPLRELKHLNIAKNKQLQAVFESIRGLNLRKLYVSKTQVDFDAIQCRFGNVMK